MENLFSLPSTSQPITDHPCNDSRSVTTDNDAASLSRSKREFSVSSDCIHQSLYCQVKKNGCHRIILARSMITYKCVMVFAVLIFAMSPRCYCMALGDRFQQFYAPDLDRTLGIDVEKNHSRSYDNEEPLLFSQIQPYLDDSCSYECCMSQYTRDTLELANGRHLRGSDESNRILQATPTNTNTPCPVEESAHVGIPVWLQYTAIVLLLVMSSIFSGLTLGLLSLDLSGLEIVMATEDANLARAARAIYPVRKNGNLLLCTLVLGNVGVNSLLSILMADLTSGLVGFVASTLSIVIFGEIFPQAFCSRFPLQVGEKAVPMVKVFMLLLGPVAYPLAFVLNKVLGREIGNSYSASEMAKLIELHVQGGHFNKETGAAMTGALRYHDMSVKDAMTPLKNTFMLSADERLGFDTVAKIFKSGYSRILVYEVSKSNVIGLLFVKDLIFLDPEDEIPVKNFVQIFGRGLHIVWPEDKLGGVLKLLKTGRSHMALVRDVNSGDGILDPYYDIKGIITLEDIIEIILGDEIVDETDELVEVNDPGSRIQRSEIGEFIGSALETSSGHEDADRTLTDVKGSRMHRSMSQGVDWESRLRLLDERLVNEHLSPDEVRAVAAHLKTNYSKAVELISDKQLKDLIASVPVTELSAAQTCPTAGVDEDGNLFVPSDKSELLYERGVAADFCTVVLTGKLAVLSGADKFRSDVSNWGVLATKALTDPSYIPDFSAWVVPTPSDSISCRCIKLDRNSFFRAVDNTALEKTGESAGKGSDPSTIGVAYEGPLRLLGVVGPGRNDVKHPHDDSKTPRSDISQISSPSYSENVKTDEQRVIHNRRGKLMLAFKRARSDE